MNVIDDAIVVEIHRIEALRDVVNDSLSELCVTLESLLLPGEHLSSVHVEAGVPFAGVIGKDFKSCVEGDLTCCTLFHLTVLGRQRCIDRYSGLLWRAQAILGLY